MTRRSDYFSKVRHAVFLGIVASLLSIPRVRELWPRVLSDLNPMRARYKSALWVRWFQWQTVKRLDMLFGVCKSGEFFISNPQLMFMRVWSWAIHQRELRCRLTQRKVNNLQICALKGLTKPLRLCRRLNLLLNAVLRLWQKTIIWK